MQQEKNKSRRLATLFWILTAGWMGVIFWFSAMPGETSAEQSLWVVRLLASLIERFADLTKWENLDTMLIVRKAAHCTEFAVLALLLNSALYFTKGKALWLIGFLLTSAYAATDELHQLLVSDRSCQVTDWLIDSAGAAIGTIGFLVIGCIAAAIMRKKKKQTDRADTDLSAS